MISLAKKKKREVEHKSFPKFLLGGGESADEGVSSEDDVRDDHYTVSDDANPFGLNDDTSPVYGKAAQLLATLGCVLDKKGYYETANNADQILEMVALGQQGLATPGDSRAIAVSLAAIIQQLLNRVQPENRMDYQYRIRAELNQLNPMEISTKRNNPSATIGSTINIVKNVLIGQPPFLVSSALQELVRML